MTAKQWEFELARLKAEVSSYSKGVELAVNVFGDAHKNQKRDDGIEPYSAHWLRVAKAVKGRGLSETAVIAACGHDVVEDQQDFPVEKIYDLFGVNVLFYILALTNLDKMAPRLKVLNRQTRKTIQGMYLSGMPLEIKLIKVEDRWDNVHSPLSTDKEEFYRTKYARETQELMAAIWDKSIDGDYKYKMLTKWTFPQ